MRPRSRPEAAQHAFKRTLSGAVFRRLRRAAAGRLAGEALYLKRHRIRAGKQAIVLTVPRLPARAGIDPHRTLIERERDDNIAEIGGGTRQDARRNDP